MVYELQRGVEKTLNTRLRCRIRDHSLGIVPRAASECRLSKQQHDGGGCVRLRIRGSGIICRVDCSTGERGANEATEGATIIPGISFYS